MGMYQLKLKEQNLKESFIEALLQNPVSFWIDSSGGPEQYNKNSFYGFNPKYYIYGGLNEVNLVECDSGAITYTNENTFDFLEEKLKEESSNKDGIFVGYISYDLFQYKSKINSTSTYPDFFFAYFDKATRHRDCFVADAPCNDVISKHLTSNMTDSEYLEKVKQIKEENKAGNVYQVNLTREYSVEIKNVDDLELYLKLRSVSPNPYGCYFKTPFISILSSSPEEFMRIELQDNERYIRTRPIKGTLPRSIFEIDPKNQAENIMIVDLERNDLGRICEYGSVHAEKLLEIESYKHLNHIVSTVEGKLKPNIKLRKIFEAMFPSGSITGAPKISAMKIINKIESVKRGAYTGTFGYIKTDGTMDFNILIRTIFIQKNKSRVTFNVGGGILADSELEGELEEIKLKAKGIMDAINIKF